MKVRHELARLPGLVVDVGFERFVASLDDGNGQFLTTIRKDNVRPRHRHRLRFAQPIVFIVAVDDRTGIARHRVEIIGRPVHRWETAAFREAVMPALRRYRRGEEAPCPEPESSSSNTATSSSSPADSSPQPSSASG